MTPRERIAKAINFQEADRVPIDLGGLKASTMAVETYDRVARRLGIHRTPRVSDTASMIAVVEEPVRRRFEADVMCMDISLVPSLMAPDKEWVPRRLFSGTDVLFMPGTCIREEADGSWVLLDENGEPGSFRMPKDGYYFDDVSFNRHEDINPAKFHPVEDIPEKTLRQVDEYSSQIYRDTDYALLGFGAGVCFLGLSIVTDPRSNVTMGMPDQWMMMLLTEKETCHEMMNRSVEAAIKRSHAAAPGRGPTLLCLGHRLRRQRHPARGVHPARTVGGDDQAALPEALRLDPSAHAVEDLSALVRLRLQLDSALYRCRH